MYIQYVHIMKPLVDNHIAMVNPPSLKGPCSSNSDVHLVPGGRESVRSILPAARPGAGESHALKPPKDGKRCM